MTRVQLLILQTDERAVLQYLGRIGMMELTRAIADPDTALRPARDCGRELARLEGLAARMDHLRRAMDLIPAAGHSPARPPPAIGAPAAGSDASQVSAPAARHVDVLAETEGDFQTIEAACAGRLQRQKELQQRLQEATAASSDLVDFREVDLPLDPPGTDSFLHFLTGSLPLKQFQKLEAAPDLALVPISERDGRKIVIALVPRDARSQADRTLHAAGFEPAARRAGTASGATTASAWAENQRAMANVTAELRQVEEQLEALAEKFAPAWPQLESAVTVERRLLEAAQQFPRTENSVLIAGWIPQSDVLRAAEDVRGITRSHCVFKLTPPDISAPGAAADIPILVRQPRWLRPFALLVTAYGLPQYRELEPTLFVAISYLLMFGMMFGDVGHGFVLAVIGACLWFAGQRTPSAHGNARPAVGPASRSAQRLAILRDAGYLLLCGGGSSMIFGALYGSCFGLEAFKSHALWHDPLSGNPMSLMLGAIKIGIVMISLGLILNIRNHLRRGDFTGALLDKFGLAGALFYWLALAVYAWPEVFRAHGWFGFAVVSLPVLAIAWMLKEPVERWRRRRTSEARPDGELQQDGAAPLAPTQAPDRATDPGQSTSPAGTTATAPVRSATEPDGATVVMESFVSVFEGLLSYFANTISFVRLAAYAMSHAALLLSAFMIAADVKNSHWGGPVLSVAVIVLGNVLAILLEGIVASVQALRLEYYEFFGKFFSGAGRMFEPFRLPAISAFEPNPTLTATVTEGKL